MVEDTQLNITLLPDFSPMLYAFSTYGQEGVEKALQILKVRKEKRLFASV